MTSHGWTVAGREILSLPWNNTVQPQKQAFGNSPAELGHYLADKCCTERLYTRFMQMRNVFLSHKCCIVRVISSFAFKSILYLLYIQHQHSDSLVPFQCLSIYFLWTIIYNSANDPYRGQHLFSCCIWSAHLSGERGCAVIKSQFLLIYLKSSTWCHPGCSWTFIIQLYAKEEDGKFT